MSLLVLIWVIAIGLATASLLWMCGLIGLRLVHEARESRRMVRRKAIDAALINLLLGKCDVELELGPYRDHVELMAEALLDFMSLVRGHDRQLVVAALRSLNVDTLLQERLRRGSPATRRVCVEALGCFPGPESQRALTGLLAGASPQIRLSALTALREAGGSVHLQRLLDDLRRGALPRSGLLEELVRKVVAEDPAEAIAALQRGDLPTYVRVMLIDGLGVAGDYSALTCLSHEVAAPEPQIRAAAAAALGELKHPAAETCLATAIDDADSRVRAAAAEAIGVAGLVQLCPPLAERLDDPVWRVRFQAATAMGRLGAGGLEALRLACTSSSDAVRRAASMALAERGLAA